MILDELRTLPTAPKDLRKFAFTLAAVFGSWGGIVFWRHGAVPLWAAFLTGFFVFFGAVLPGALRAVYLGWMGLALCLGWVMTRVILTVLFYGVLTPLALILRARGKDLLDRRIDRAAVSYWNVRKDAPDKARHTKQF